MGRRGARPPARTGTSSPATNIEDTETRSSSGDRSSARLSQDTVYETLQVSSYKGDWPPPDFLAAGDKTFPGFAERVLCAVETRARHRRTIESVAQIGAIGVAIFSIWRGTEIILHATYWHQSAAGVAVVMIGVGGPVVARRLVDLYRNADRPKQRQQTNRNNRSHDGSAD